VKSSIHILCFKNARTQSISSFIFGSLGIASSSASSISVHARVRASILKLSGTFSLSLMVIVFIFVLVSWLLYMLNNNILSKSLILVNPDK
jgi:hypothetical protein